MPTVAALGRGCGGGGRLGREAVVTRTVTYAQQLSQAESGSNKDITMSLGHWVEFF